MLHSKNASNKDMDILGPDLMPTVSTDYWPMSKRLHTAQKKYGVKTDHKNTKSAYPLYVNERGKIILPKEDPVTLEVIAICHQGDLVHRSAMDTLEEFRNHYTMQGMGRKAEEEFVKALCRRCLSCIKTKTGKTIPRPMWYMVYATRPFEYIHIDFIELPEAVDGCKYILCITDDFSLTTVLHPTKHADADTVVKVMLEQYLPVYPDPDLIHSDGGTHFVNNIVKKLTKARGIKHTICTPYAKWAHGVAEANNKRVLTILRTLCRKLGKSQGQWSHVVKLVQGAMQRQGRASRGGKSPIELTTSIIPRTAASMLYTDAKTLDVLDEDASKALDETAKAFAEHMVQLYDAANLARRAMSKRNRKRTSDKAVPKIDVGDFVLYAKHKKDTKLDYTWLGPCEVVKVVTPLVYQIRPYTLYESQPFDVHIQRLRRFAGKQLTMTEQLRLEVNREHPDNIVSKIVGHEMKHGTLYMKVRWKGFTAEMDTAQEATELFESCPHEITEYYASVKAKKNDELHKFMQEYFPSLAHEQEVERRKKTAGDIAPGKKKRQRVKGRTIDQAMQESATASAQQKQQAKKQKKKAAQQAQQPTEAAMREAANSARDKRAAKRNEQKSESSAEPEENTEEAHASAAEPEAEAATPISEATAEQPKKRKRGRPKKTETESWAKWKSTYKQKAQPMYALNTEVRDSKQKGAGKGLFMLEKAKVGDRVAVYAGEQITEEEAKARDSQYILRVKE